MKKTTLLSILVLSIIAFSCNKKVADYNPDFIGKWRSDPVMDPVLTTNVRSELIFEGNDGLFNNTCRDTCTDRLCDCISTNSGKAVLNTSKDQMRIGSSQPVTLSIEQEPLQDASGDWTIIINGLTYHKEP